MKHNIKFTVIIPYFNSADTIIRLLESIPERDDIEVILVNDNCSTFDGIQFKLGNRVQCYTNNSDNRGAGACRNIGIRQAKGDYLIFADSDDFFTKDAFSHFFECCEDSPDIVYFSPISIFKDGNVGSQRHSPYKLLVQNYISYGDQSIRYKFYVPWSKMIKKDFVETNEILFDEVVASNDINFSLKVGYFASSIKVSKEHVYCVVESNNSLTKTYTKEVVISRFNAICEYNDFVNKYDVPVEKIRMIYFLKLIAKVDLFTLVKSFIFVLKNRYPII
ncbi:glycosyltransferase family 2 protein [Vibrio metschnikovii]|nr:glycosyltransferase family 2 protein [Vibrio metschnikovii]